MITPKKSQNEAPPAEDPTATALKAMQEILEQLQPLIAFHKKCESAREDDLQMFWDLRIVQGEDKLLARIQGTSSMPLALAPNMLALAPSMIQQEVIDKIARPLVSAMQSKVEERVLKPRQQETHDTHHDDNSGTPPDTEVDHSSPATPSGQSE